MNFTKIVAIISCTTGIAHTYIAAEAIKEECKKKGHVYKVEMQGALGIENKFSEKDIETTDLIVSVNDVGISKAKRSDVYKDKIVRCAPHQVI